MGTSSFAALKFWIDRALTRGQHSRRHASSLLGSRYKTQPHRFTVVTGEGGGAPQLGNGSSGDTSCRSLNGQDDVVTGRVEDASIVVLEVHDAVVDGSANTAGSRPAIPDTPRSRNSSGLVGEPYKYGRVVSSILNENSKILPHDTRC